MGKVVTSLLENQCRQVRKDILQMMKVSGPTHLGGSFSSVEILVVLFHLMDYAPHNFHAHDRDHFILSKGHAAPPFYSLLAGKGFFPREDLLRFRSTGSSLKGHPDRLTTPGIEIATGSLGQGLSVGVGLALAGKKEGKSFKTYVLLGDGELDEGQVWEGMAAAAHYGLQHLIAIVDVNGLQLDGPTDRIMNLAPLPEKLRAFGWQVYQVDGHDLEKLITVFTAAARDPFPAPKAILAYTVKGKGVSFLEGRVESHSLALDDDDFSRALAELGG